MKKLTPQKAAFIQIAMLAIGGIIGCIGAYTSEALLLVGMIIMLGSIVFHICFYRCPHCGCYLGRVKPVYCHQCGKRIEED